MIYNDLHCTYENAIKTMHDLLLPFREISQNYDGLHKLIDSAS